MCVCVHIVQLDSAMYPYTPYIYIYISCWYDIRCTYGGFLSRRGTPNFHPFLDGALHEINQPASGYLHLRVSSIWGNPQMGLYITILTIINHYFTIINHTNQPLLTIISPLIINHINQPLLTIISPLLTIISPFLTISSPLIIINHINQPLFCKKPSLLASTPQGHSAPPRRKFSSTGITSWGRPTKLGTYPPWN